MAAKRGMRSADRGMAGDLRQRQAGADFGGRPGRRSGACLAARAVGEDQRAQAGAGRRRPPQHCPQHFRSGLSGEFSVRHPRLRDVDRAARAGTGHLSGFHGSLAALGLHRRCQHGSRPADGAGGAGEGMVIGARRTCLLCSGPRVAGDRGPGSRTDRHDGALYQPRHDRDAGEPGSAWHGR